MEIFHKYGLAGGFRILHVMSAVMWMGLLWFFNFVQTPAYAEMEPGARNNAFDKLTWRALWWFRYAAMFTVASGLLILFTFGFGDSGYGSDFWKSPPGMGLAAAILFALIMLYNVLGVIWPNQQIVIANARNVQAGGEPNPAAPAAARAGAMASRQNTIFSFTVFLFMVGTSHFFNDGSHFKEAPLNAPAAGIRVLFYIVLLAVAVVFELNALGKLGGTAAGGYNVIYDTHQYAIYTAVGMMVFFYLFFEIFCRA
jgi:uncharacterized membrane protein